MNGVTRDMVAADVLKVRRHRGTMATALLLSVGTTVLYFLTVRLRAGHDIDATRLLSSGSTLLGLYFGSFTAVLVGSAAATLDATSGVQRDLVATGRSRGALFLATVPAAVVLGVACNLAGYLVTVAAALTLRGGRPAPDPGLVLSFGGWVVLCTTVVTCLAVAVAGLTGSRAMTLTIVVAFQTVATTVLFSAQFLGALRGGLPAVALSHLRPGPGVGTRGQPGSSGALPALLLPMSTTVALAVLAGWVLIPIALAVWRGRARDA